MPLSLNPSSVNNAINTLFQINNRNPYSDDRSNGLKTTAGVKKNFGDTFVTSSQLKNSLNDPYAHLALSLRDSSHPGSANQVAQLLAAGLDGNTDGYRDGMITVNDSSNWGGKSQISASELASALSSGQAVLGEGGKIMSRQEALSHGDTIVSVHEDKAGPTLALDR